MFRAQDNKSLDRVANAPHSCLDDVTTTATGFAAIAKPTAVSRFDAKCPDRDELKQRSSLRRPLAAYDVVRLFLGALLLTAAALKGFELATEPVAATSLFSSRWFLIGLVEFELSFGLWLFSGLFPPATWRAALICFGGFACVSLFSGLTGTASCGCFGKVPVNPWWMLGFDLTTVAALLRWQPTDLHLRKPTSDRALRMVVVTAVALSVGIPGGVAMATYSPAALTAEGDIIGQSEFVVLEPQEWIGNRFPLLEFIDIGDQLAEGEWIVVLYHHDCPKCREAKPRYEKLAADLQERPAAPRVAMIEMPPYAAPDAEPVVPGTSSVAGRLDDRKEWLLVVPLEISLKRAIVRSIFVPADDVTRDRADAFDATEILVRHGLKLHHLAREVR